MKGLAITRRESLSTLSSLAALGLTGCWSSPPEAPSVPNVDAEANALLGRLGQNLLQRYPETATTLGIDSGDNAHLRSQLTNRSSEGQQQFAAMLRSDLTTIEAVDSAALSHSVRTSIAVVKSAYRVALDGFALPYGDVAVGGWRNTPYVVIQNVGAYLDTPRFLDADHPINTNEDAEAYIARLESMAVQLDGELGRLQAAAAKGLIAPNFLLDQAIIQMQQSVDTTRSGGGLVESIVRRTQAANLAGDWQRHAESVVIQSITPALQRQLSELQSQRSKAINDAGMWARPDGDAWYAWALRASTTTTMSADEVHQLGLSQLEELHAQMDPILRKLSYTEGSVGTRMTALANDSRFQFAEGDAGRAEILAYIQEWLDKFRSLTPLAFATLVRGNVEVRRLPLEEEPGAPAAYGGAGSIDGSIPGKFWLNLRTTDLHSKYSLPDLAAHEAIPGHVWQGEYANQLPPIRSLLAFNAYSEGWGLYAEQLVDELGAYNNFEVGRLGFLQSLAFRACRLVVDTGLHAKRWSREQAVQFFVERNGSNPLEVASEVDRYCSWPGQACGYKVGHSEIVRQRNRAQIALGSRYNLRKFNDSVVQGGNVPLDVLAQNVDAYIASEGV